jgi:hypothetical protein
MQPDEFTHLRDLNTNERLQLEFFNRHDLSWYLCPRITVSLDSLDDKRNEQMCLADNQRNCACEDCACE